MAPEIQPVLDPADHQLMLTPEQLRNAGSKNVNVSFLRKTQYMTSQNARANDPLMRTTGRPGKGSTRSASTVEPQIISRDDPINIKPHIQKGFDIAYPESVPQYPPLTTKSAPSTAAEREMWLHPIHPDNQKLKPVAYFPVLPDLEAFTDMTAYMSVKFDKPPLPALHGQRDDRVDVAVLRASAVTGPPAGAWQAKKDAYERNSELYEDPGPQPFDWDFCIPRVVGREALHKIKRKLNDADLAKNDDGLYEGLYDKQGAGTQPGIDYEKARTYTAPTADSTDGTRFMALSLRDPERAHDHSRLKERAAYYYPVGQRIRLKIDRAKATQQKVDRPADDESQNAIDGIRLMVREPTLAEVVARARYRAEVDSAFKEEYERLERETLDNERHAEGLQEAESIAVGGAELRSAMGGEKENGADEDDNAMAE